jgi:hypothetical protein
MEENFMKLRNWVPAVLLTFVIFTNFANAQIPAVSNPNSEVISMVRARVPTSVIVAYIRSNPVGLDRSPSAIIVLNSAGVPIDVLNAIVAPATTTSRSVATEQQTLPQQQGNVSAVEADRNLSASQRAAAEQRAFMTALQNVAIFTFVRQNKVELTSEAFVVRPPLTSGQSFLLSALGAGNATEGIYFSGQISSLRMPRDDISFLISYPSQRLPSDISLQVVKLVNPALSKNQRAMNRTRAITYSDQQTVDEATTNGRAERSKIVPILFERSLVTINDDPKMQTFAIRFMTPLQPGEYTIMYAGKFFTFGVD